MNITEEELRSWSRDFYNVLLQGKAVRDCLSSSIDNQPNESFREVLTAVREVIEAGYPLSKAMSLNPAYFDEKYVTIVRYGEIHGELDLTLQRYLERPEDMMPVCRVPTAQ